jgi:hypothetical protein
LLRSETWTAFVLRAIQNEVIRCSGGDPRALFEVEHNAAAEELQRLLDAGADI